MKENSIQKIYDLLKLQKIYDLLKQAKGNRVPESHIIAVMKLPKDDVIKLCSRLITFRHDVFGRNMRNGDHYEMFYWWDAKK